MAVPRGAGRQRHRGERMGNVLTGGQERTVGRLWRLCFQLETAQRRRGIATLHLLSSPRLKAPEYQQSRMNTSDKFERLPAMTLTRAARDRKGCVLVFLVHVDPCLPLLIPERLSSDFLFLSNIRFRLDSLLQSSDFRGRIPLRNNDPFVSGGRFSLTTS